QANAEVNGDLFWAIRGILSPKQDNNTYLTLQAGVVTSVSSQSSHIKPIPIPITSIRGFLPSRQCIWKPLLMPSMHGGPTKVNTQNALSFLPSDHPHQLINRPLWLSFFMTVLKT